MVGSPEAFIVLYSSDTGLPFYLEQASGTVNALYLDMSDSHAQGGASFYADNSNDLGNNMGWNITANVPDDYYWIGGAGDWSDVAHWATSSGGSELHTSPPTSIDDVYFDANSFDSPDQIVQLDITASCHDLDMSAVDEVITVNQSTSQVLNLYGSLWLAPGSIQHLFSVTLHSQDEDAYIYTADAGLGNNADLDISGGADFHLDGSLSCRQVFLEEGDFYANGNDITTEFKFQIYLDQGGYADLSDCLIDTRMFHSTTYPGSEVAYDGSTIMATGSLISGIDTLATVIMSGTQASIQDEVICEHFIAEPGTQLEILAGWSLGAFEFTLEGTETDSIIIYSDLQDAEGYIYCPSGTVQGHYLDITDNHAYGGAEFIANNSTLNSNVEGWQLNNPPSSTEEWTAERVSIYPNPSQGLLVLPQELDCQWALYDQQGRLVQRLAGPVGAGVYDLSALPAGVYLLQGLAEDGRLYSSPWIKE